MWQFLSGVQEIGLSKVGQGWLEGAVEIFRESTV